MTNYAPHNQEVEKIDDHEVHVPKRDRLSNKTGMAEGLNEQEKRVATAASYR